MDQTIAVHRSAGKRLAFALLYLSIGACVSEKSSDPRLGNIIHQCFRITDDAILYRTPNCPPVGGLNGTSTCVTLRYLNKFSPPLTLSEFNMDAHGAAATVAEQLTPRANGGPLLRALNAPPKATLLGSLAKGTSITIEGMRRFSHPEQGSMWVTTAAIHEGEFANLPITLPWKNLGLEFHGDGGWINDFVQLSPFVVDPYRPQIDLTALIPCETSIKSPKPVGG